MNFKKVYYKHMMMIDTAYHIVFEVDGKLGHVRMPMGGIFTLALQSEPEPDPVRIAIEKLIGEGVELQHMGDWNNIRDENGMIEHPFKDMRVRMKDLKLDYSNWFNASWRRWFPKKVEAKVYDTLDKLKDAEAAVKILQTKLNLITDKDYSEEKAKS